MTPLTVQVRLFASIREAVGAGRLDLEVPEGATVGDVVERLGEDHPEVARHPDLVLARNRTVVDGDEPVEDGDEVAVFPPVSGGGGRGAGGDADDESEEAARPDRIETGLAEDLPPLQAFLDRVRTDGTGAVVTFTGVVRDHSRGRRVERLDYEAYGAMAEESLRDLVARAKERFDIEDAVVVHRTGSHGVGQPVATIAVAAAHREAAFEACRWLIDTLKVEAPIWKKEHGEGGATWVEGHA